MHTNLKTHLWHINIYYNYLSDEHLVHLKISNNYTTENLSTNVSLE